MKGSFAQGVIRRADTNVLCVPLHHRHARLPLPAIRRVLVATDFSECGNAAIRHAFSLLRSGDSMRLLHVTVQPPPVVGLGIGTEAYVARQEPDNTALHAAKEKLDSLVPRLLATADISVSCEALEHHDVAAAIREAASRFGADVICMGTTGHSRARMALLGSTVQAVLAHAHIPVFAVTPPVQ